MMVIVIQYIEICFCAKNIVGAYYLLAYIIQYGRSMSLITMCLFIENNARDPGLQSCTMVYNIVKL